MAGSGYFDRHTITFLKDLKANNDRQWFADNKARYEEHVKAPALDFIADFSPRLEKLDPHWYGDPKAVGGSFFRIYRDTRFGSDKTPYKTNIGLHFRHKKSARDVHSPGFYLHVEPGQNFAAGGVWHPDGPALKKIRGAIVSKPREWAKVLAADLPLEGEALKRPPKGYDAEHPHIEDLKRKDYIAAIPLKNKDVQGPASISAFEQACKRILVLNRFLSRALDLH